MFSKKTLAHIFGFMSFLGMGIGWYAGLFQAPIDANQGHVYRIIFIHVPAAACALGLCSAGLFVSSIITLARPQGAASLAARSWAEIGALFTLLTLMTGSLWGRPTWGTWWTWDARLTTTLLLFLMLVGYLFLYHSLPNGTKKARICAILAIFICMDVPIIYKSVSWWRTLHQPASIIETRGKTLDPLMLKILLINIIFMLLYTVYLWWQRFYSLKLKEQITALSLQEIKKGLPS